MKKSIKIFALLAIAGAMTFVGCKKDDENETSNVNAESLTVTFGGDIMPIGWYDAFINEIGNGEIQAAKGLNDTKGYENVIYPMVDFVFNDEGIYDIIYNENQNRTEPVDDDNPDIVAEWLYDPNKPTTFSISGFDPTELTLARVNAKATLYDFYADFVEHNPNPAEKELSVTATNVTFDSDAKGAKLFHR